MRDKRTMGRKNGDMLEYRDIDTVSKVILSHSRNKESRSRGASGFSLF